MKKSILFKALLATLLLILPTLRSFAYDFYNKDTGIAIYYNITSSEEDNYTVEVTAKEYNSTSNSSAYPGDVVIPSTVEYNGTTYYVTGIGDYAFYNCKSLTSIELPSNLTSIGAYAFYTCKSLTSIAIPSNVTSIGKYAFYSCFLITSIEIPSSVTSIGDNAFQYCTSLTSIVIPNSVTSISAYAFQNCTSLTSIVIPNSITNIGDYAFQSCTSLSHITSLNPEPPVCDNNVFNGIDYNSCLLSVPVGSKEAYASAYEWNEFYNIEETEEETYDDSSSDISNFSAENEYGTTIYYNVTSSEEGNYTVEVTNIFGASTTQEYQTTKVALMLNIASEIAVAEKQCENILDEVNEIYNSGDYDAESVNLIMEEISGLMSDINSQIREIYNSYGISISAEYTEGYKNLQNEITAIMAEIKDYLDASNSEDSENQKEVIKAEIEETIQELISLAATVTDPISTAYVDDVIIPSTVEYEGITYTVTSIGVSAFNGSTNLTSIEIPSSVTSIGESAFSGCSSLSNITSLNPEPPVCASDAFDSVDKTTCILTVPVGAKELYASADVWNEFDNIKEAGEETSSSFTYDSNTVLDADYLINNKITELIIGEDVVSIPEIFSQMKYLEKIYYYAVNAGIAEALEILKSIFANCPNLKTFVFGDKVQVIPDYLLRDCVGIESIELPSSITSIGKNAFDGCTGLNKIVLPSGIKEIGIGAFKGCINLKSVEGFGSLGITAIPDSLFHGCTALESIEIPSGVTSIGKNAFYYCENITIIEITNNVTIIGDNAFGNCSNLKTLEYNAKNMESLSGNAFSNCPVESMTIGEKVEYVPMELNQLTNITTIYYNAVSADIAISVETLQSLFSYFKNLTNFIIGETVKTIVDYVLKNCVSIESIELPSSITSIGKGLFDGCIKLKEIKGFGDLGITALPDSVFHGCIALEKIELPSGIKDIGMGVFEGCTGLKSVEGFGKLNITVIPDRTFHGCTALEKIEIPSGVTSIGKNAFYYCENITTIEITNNITIIGDNAFGKCTNLETLIFNAKNIESLSENAFSDCPVKSMTIGENVEFVPIELNQLTNITIIYYNAVNAEISISAETLNSIFAEFKNLTSFIIGETVKTLADYFLKNCVSIESIELPSGITSIGKGTFDGCIKLKDIKDFGDLGITALPDSVFHGCIAIENIELPSGIKDIGMGVFDGCTGLKSVEGFGKLNITVIPDRTFNGCTALEKIEIPSSVTSIGKNAFYYCENITSIEITNNITIIGDNAFGKCTNLEKLIFNAKNIESLSENAFSDCPVKSMTIGENVEFVPMELNQLTNITIIYYNAVNAEISISAETLNSIFAEFKNLTSFIIGETVKSIADYLLKNCASLESIEIPGSVESIGKHAFDGCTGMKEIVFNGGIKDIGAGAFNGCIKLKDITGFGDLGITALPDSIFHGCVSIEQIELPSGLISIGDHAFAGQEGQPMKLKDIDFGDNSKLQSIGKNAFYYCENITSIEITNNITIIGDNAFGKCTNLEKLIFNAKNIESFSENAFSDCPVKSMTIGENVEFVPMELNQLTNITIIYYNAVNAEISISAETLNSIFAEFKNLTSFIIGETVKSIADYFFRNCTTLESIELSNNIESIGIGAFHGCTSLKEIKGFGNLGITALPDSIFHSCVALEQIELPSGIKKIGMGMFEGCISLKEIIGFGSLNITIIPDHTFHGCVALEKIEIPSGVTSIGKYAFYSCENITSIEITNNITIIGDNAFGKCTNLEKLIFNAKNIESLSENAFSDCPVKSMTIGEDVELVPMELNQLTNITIIYYNAVNAEISISAETLNSIFAEFKNLTSFIIGETVKSIADYLLKNCTALESIELPSSIEGIGRHAFDGCSGLKQIVLPSGIKDIGAGAFNDCTNLKDINGFGNLGIEAIPDSIFHGCVALEQIELPSSIKEIGMGVFEGCISLKEIIGFGSLNITVIPDHTFHGCIALEKIELPNGLISIGDYAFAGQEGQPMKLKDIDFGDNSQLQSIGKYAFYYCENITSIKITNNITIIGAGAFANCTGLAAIYSFAPTPATCDGNEVFKGIPGTCVLYVPAGLEKEYGEYGSNYEDTWSSVPNVRTFHSLNIAMEENPDVDNNIAGYGYTSFYNGKYTYTLPEGMKAAIVKSSVSDSGDEIVPTLSWQYDGDDKENAVIPANTAVIIYGSIDNYMLMVDYDETATNTDKYGIISSKGNVQNTNFLYGCWNINELYTDDTYTEGVTYAYDDNGGKTVEGYLFYKLGYDSESDGTCSNIGFYWAEDNGKPFSIEAKEVWLALPSSTGATDYLGINYDADEDIQITDPNQSAINAIFSDQNIGDDRIYNLAGQRVNNMNQRGIYIVNGKKVAKTR